MFAQSKRILLLFQRRPGHIPGEAYEASGLIAQRRRAGGREPPTRTLHASLAGALIACLSAGSAGASDLVYQLTSPSFGGNSLNGTYALGLAGADNYRFNENPHTRQRNQGLGTDPAQLRTQVTSSLLSQIGQQILGEHARDGGTCNLSGTIVDFIRAGGQININVRDTVTGSQTAIQIPVPNF